MRLPLFLLLSASLPVPLFAQHGTIDPSFEKIPFDRWLSEGNQAHFHWGTSVGRAELSFHQRLVSDIEIKLDGRDLETRRHNGHLVFFVQITDREGARYQQHGAMELEKLAENVKAMEFRYEQRAFILPGDYQLAIVILDTGTGDHSASQSKFRVTEPRDLPTDSWRDLPSVEFIVNHESPESWFLPTIEGRLRWAADARSPVRLNVTLNVAPSSGATESHQTPSGGLPALLPTLKVISQTGSPAISEHIELLDLSRRRKVFDQNDSHELDWPRLKTSLAESNTASIDLHSLAERHQDAQFFVSEVRKTLRESSDTPCVLVVLTKSVSFESGEDLRPISLEALPPCSVFYIRYQAMRERLRDLFSDERMGRRGMGGRRGGPMPGARRDEDGPDQLAATLKPLNPRIFDIETPEQMAKALGEIERALTRVERSLTPKSYIKREPRQQAIRSEWFSRRFE